MTNLIILVVLLLIWYFFWSMAEKNHYKRIIAKEKELSDITVFWKHETKLPWFEWNKLVASNIVISIDYFKKFIAGFINIFGWRMAVYESLLDRARRDTLVKIKQQAKDSWFNSIANLRIETSSISKWTKWNIWSIEVLAYATAINYNK